MPTHRYYFAYGSNLNLMQMLTRCPSAMPLKPEKLLGWRLEFRGVATVHLAPCAAAPTPEEEDADLWQSENLWAAEKYVQGAIYRITPEDELALDRYEGYCAADPERGLYDKDTLEFLDDRGEIAEAMFYVMTRGPIHSPSPFYLRTIEQGYRDWGLNPKPLQEAVWRAEAATLVLPL